MAAARFVDRLNEQIAYEFAASQQYVANAVYYDSLTLPRLAAFFYAQAVEERNHAMMMVNYLLDADARVTIPGVASPETEFGDIVAPVALALEQERRVSDQIGELMGVAREETRLPQRAVPAVVPQGAGRGGLDDVLAAGGGRALRRFADADRGLPGARARRSPRRSGSDRPGRGRRSALARARRRSTCSSPRRIVTSLGVEVLEQRLGELARGAQLVAQLSQRDDAAVPLARSPPAAPGCRPARRRGSAGSWTPARRGLRPAARPDRAASSSESSGGSTPASRSRCSSASAELDRGSWGLASLGVPGAGRARPVGSELRPDGSGASPRARRSSRTSTSRLGPCRRGCASSTRPPPSVSGGAIWRTTSRSPAAGTIGCSRRTCQKRPPSQASRAGASRVPWWIWTRSPCSGSASGRTRARRRPGSWPAGSRRPRRARPRARSRPPRCRSGSRRRAARPARGRPADRGPGRRARALAVPAGAARARRPARPDPTTACRSPPCPRPGS